MVFNISISIQELLLIANFLVFLAVALEGKIKSRLGAFIVLSGLFIGIVDLIFVFVY